MGPTARDRWLPRSPCHRGRLDRRTGAAPRSGPSQSPVCHGLTPSSRSAAEILDGVRADLGSVPHSSSDFVCKLCLGPVSDFFTHCYGCNKLSETAPAGLWRHVVPMTTALNPSSWYSRLVASNM